MAFNDRTITLLPAAGTTVLDADFPLQSATEITVTRTRASVATVLAWGSDYSVTDTGAPNYFARLTLTVASLAGDSYELDGNTVIDRISDYEPELTPSGDQVNGDLNRATHIMQELRRDLTGFTAIVSALSLLNAVGLGDLSSLIHRDGSLPMQAGLTLSGNATADLHAVPRQQVLGQLEAINVKSAPYNAKGDAKEITITTAAGSNAFIASAAVFSEGSVGKTICTKYGGIANASITATITGYVSPTTVTTSVSATLNSSGPAVFGSNDTPAFVAAIAAAGNRQIVATGGMYLVNKLVTSGLLALAGAGMGLAAIVFLGTTDNLEYRGTGSPWSVQYPSVHLKDISLLGAYDANTSLGVLDVEFSYGQSPNRYAVFDNVRVGTLGLGWDCGWRLWNASNYSINQCNVAGYGSIRAGSMGLSVGGDEKPIDMYNFGLRVYFCDYGVKVSGQALFSNVMEGISFIGGALLFNNHGLWVETGAPFPYVQVNGCNLNNYKKDIFLRNIHQAHIINNLLYSCDRTPHEANWNGIEISNTAGGPAANSANIIAGNIISGANTPDTSTACIVVDASGGADTATVISKNLMTGADYGIIAFAGSNNVKIFDNEYQNVTTKVTNSGTNNIVAGTTFGAQWSTTSNDGLITKGGVQTVTLGAGGRAVVNFPVPFPSTCYNVVAQKAVGDANSKYMHPDSFIPGSFNIYVPAGAIGESWTVTYVAVGK